jgi:hypothetical protein
MQKRINAYIDSIQALNYEVIAAKAKEDLKLVIHLQDQIIELQQELTELVINA